MRKILAVLVMLFVCIGAAAPVQAAGKSKAPAYTKTARLLVQGGNLSWTVGSQCDRGPKSCNKILKKVNKSANKYGVHFFEDGSAWTKSRTLKARMITKGANTAQGVWYECGRGPKVCNRALTKANKVNRQVIFFEDGSAALRRR